MNTHLIDKIDNFGIWDDDYAKFFDKRVEAFIEKLKLRIKINDQDTI